MDFVTIPGGEFDLGWRFGLPEPLSSNATAAEAYVARCSPKRRVTLASFDIAREAVRLSELVGDPYELDVLDLSELCELVDARLAERGLRLASEDELEVAAGGTLFPWGEQIPDGIPHGRETSFVAHQQPNAFGLRLLGDPYKTELARTALKFGDGGTSICGDDSGPLAWLTLSTCFRWMDRDIAECFPETLEETFVRPVRLG